MENVTSSSKPDAKFTVYQNPALSAALTTNSLRPSKLTIFFIITLLFVSAVSLISFILWENDIVDSSKLRYVPQDVAYYFLKVLQAFVALVFIGSVFALFKALSALAASSPNDESNLTNRQLGLLGLKPKFPPVEVKAAKYNPSDRLVPIHPPFTGWGHISPHLNHGGNKMHTFGTPYKPPVLSSVYHVPSQSPNMKTPTGLEQYVSSPWRGSPSREISTEKQLETFLADIDEKFSMSAVKMATPPPTISGFGSPGTNTSGPTRSTPLRAVHMSPGSQKFGTPPWKGEGYLPPPMTMEDSIAVFECLGVYPQIEQWRDHLRQWFSSVLLNPLLAKIDTSHLKVMEAAAKLGISVLISKVGSDSTTEAIANVTSRWQPVYTLNEERLVLLQLRTSLVQTLDSMSRSTLGGFQHMQAQNPSIPAIQECIDLITEHQKLLALVKGELAKGLLPQSSLRADYTVQRIRELAAGSCVKSFEYISNNQSGEWPTDSQLLLYLFCAFLEHPKWMLHVDPRSPTGVQSSKNPLFIGLLPPKERFPENYLAVVSGVPSVLHPGASVLTVSKQCPPVFSLYWDKKPQFSFEGRTAFWDSVVLLCHKIKTDYGGIVRGMHLGSSALGILPFLDQYDY